MLTIFKFVRRALIGVALGLAQAANAWGTQGHEVVAALAQARLTIPARTQVDKLLALEPGATLASISKLADEQRNPATAGWHFVNFPKGSCSYEPQRHCPDGNCVVGAIMRQLEILGSAAPPEERLAALKYVVHLVGDVHQPLHAGHAEDRGGNTYQLDAFMRGTNLHAVWDLWLIRNLGLSNEALVARLQARPVAPGELNAGQAAEESCRIVGTAGYYPGRKLDTAYIEQFTPVMEARLALAGARLAAALNRVWR